MVDWTAHMRRVTAVLGEAMSFTHAAGAPVPITAPFFRPFEIATMQSGINIAASRPRAYPMTADIPGAVRGDTLVIRGVTYKITGIDADPISGVTGLELEDES